MRLVLVVIVSLALCGCGLIPKETNKSQSAQSAEAISIEQEKTIRRTLEIGPEKAIQLARDGSVTSTPLREDTEIVTRTTTGAGTLNKASGSYISSIPLFVKLIGAAIGIGALFGVGLLIWKKVSATALGQGIRLADEVLARKIQGLRKEAQLSADQSVIARANAEIAELEAERGKLKR